ncbi:MAG: hypothetical protein LBH42_01985 [Treponema sp.]|jgi:hypothetical protein|nr:hypothetical protein [Treponema sp.]
MSKFYTFQRRINPACLKVSKEPADIGIVMKRYCLKSQTGKTEYFDILKETADGYIIRITRLVDGYEKIINENMSRHLFDICVKTGYIYELTDKANPAA